MVSFSGGPRPEPIEVVKVFLAQAIRIGAPVYNAGDPRGCYDIYAATARMLLRVVEGADEATTVLRSALESSAVINDIDRQAWTMRHAFDAILGEDEPPMSEDDE